MRKRFLIVDTNVPLKAACENPEDDIDKKCAFACLKFIKRIMKSSDVVVLDSEYDILKEYIKQMKKFNQDNVAKVFFKWVLKNLSSNRIQKYNITKLGDNEYVEFPRSHELVHFDFSDRKFVALAKAHPSHPPIYNGSDTDWWDYRDALEKEGVHIVFLCEDYMIVKSKK